MTDACWIQSTDSRAPALCDDLKLSVAVELVAEEVEEADGARAEPAGHLGQGGLVHLEEPQLRAVSLEQRRGDAGDEIRPGAIVRQAHVAAEDFGHHRGRRRLAVRRRDQHRAAREAPGEAIDRVGIELPQELAGDGRPSACAGKTRQPSDGACSEDLGLQREPHGPASVSRVREGTAECCASSGRAARRVPAAPCIFRRVLPGYAAARRIARRSRQNLPSDGARTAGRERSSKFRCGLKRFCLATRPSFRTSSVPSSIERRRSVMPV